ncbi:hypothetical protein PVAND_016453 [Polypedilum vanderplanki]|uniref:Uncharacterized protein n=1 Tax=Polypedilum vanderplanki TaxID=319348 RepID=A0A9J6BFM8_POLVA|nr:hypothetical protein PVAND_016453 [Polypedilum vanderplanki]
MFKFFVATFVIFSVFIYSSAMPQKAAGKASAGATAVAVSSGSSNLDASATIITNNFTDDGAGNFAYNYETSNQIKADAKGSPKEIPDADGKPQQGEVQQGSFSFVAPDGQTYSVQWIADEKGFQPQGAHLPTTPPTPAASA